MNEIAMPTDDGSLTSQDVAALLAQSVGDERALALVEEACGTLGYTPGRMTETEALSIYEHLTATPGLVGIAARFAKSRAHLRWSRPG